MHDDRIRLVVLFGGRSAEHDVSCVSARHIIAAADRRKYRIEPVFITKNGNWIHAIDVLGDQKTHPILQNDKTKPEGRLIAAPDDQRSESAELPDGFIAGQAINPLVFFEKSITDNPTTKKQHNTTPTVRTIDEKTSGLRNNRITVVMPVLHGPMGEDGTVQGLLELADVPYVGCGVLASAMCMDKATAKTIMTANGIAQAASRTVTIEIDDPADDDTAWGGTWNDKDDTTIEIGDSADDGNAPAGAVEGVPVGTIQALHSEAVAAVEDLGLPMFIKPSNMGSSVGISKAFTIQEVEDALILASKYDRTVVMEEFLNAREIEVSVMGNDEYVTSVPGEIIPDDEFYTYSDKYSAGAELLIPAPLDTDEISEVRSLAVSACRALRVTGLARVDFFYEDGCDGRGDRGWFVNELNTMPGFTPISMYPKLWNTTGISYPELIDRLVELALERHFCRQRHTCIELLTKKAT